MCIILMELNYLQDYELGYVIYVNTNLDTIFKAHFATTVGIMKQPFTSFSTAQITQIIAKSFSKKLVTSNVVC